ncbi:potassium channel family protein [Desulfonauticus submarinus]|uniref:Trk system potassium uptake protein TrkA n=1 Tax=Desulfonauticus submarinus TaxID=206665 RepID=A0A1H0A3P9_9BACT|nr:TrkA family potassium uptake protein [Desulfonauticus submarinus]SDN28047.1 trk system potassium uptake protein TrkA [Desulfonauticus submarinus]
MAKFEVGVIGLGKFGFYLAKSLVNLGHNVVGLDNKSDRIKRAQDILTQVYEADATDKGALSQLGFADLNHVIISVGHSMEASILIALYLKELGAKDIWCKAISDEHEKVLLKIGVDHVIFPERFAAEQLARSLVVPGLIDYLPMGKGVLLKEIIVSSKWEGKTLRELDLTNQYGVQAIAIKTQEKGEYTFVPKADQKLKKGDILAIVGKEESFKELSP